MSELIKEQGPLVGVLLVVLYIVIREFLTYIQKQKHEYYIPQTNGKTDIKDVVGIIKGVCKDIEELEKDIDTIKSETHQLFLMHDFKDSDGVYRWYFKQSLENALVKLTDFIQEETTVIKIISSQVAELTNLINNLTIKAGKLEDAQRTRQTK